MRTALGAVIALVLTGCMPPATRFGSTVPDIAPRDSDVIWVTRSATYMDSNGGRDVVHGLFACYRKPATSPGAPVCYLAEFANGKGPVKWDDMMFTVEERPAQPAAVTQQ